jgi:hypothetical protein
LQEEVRGKDREINDLRAAFTNVRSDLMLATSALKKSEDRIAQLEKDIINNTVCWFCPECFYFCIFQSQIQMLSNNVVTREAEISRLSADLNSSELLIQTLKNDMEKKDNLISNAEQEYNPILKF